jgi:hypothetical protein
MNLNVYPNPSNGLFTLDLQSLPERSELEIYNILGEKVYDEVINSSNVQIDLSDKPKGIYFFKIGSVGKVSSRKLVIE